MQSKFLKLTTLLLLVVNQMAYSSECDALNILKCSLYKLQAISDCNNNNPNLENIENNSKLSAAMDVIKCTIYKLENLIKSEESCSDNNEENGEEDCQECNDCPSLNFDCNDCPSLNFDCDDKCSNQQPITVNINCDKLNKLKICFAINNCKTN